MPTGAVEVTEEQQIALEQRYGVGGYEVTRRYELDGGDVVLVVRFTSPAWGYSVLVGNDDDLERVGGTATEWSARWIASNYAPEARPAS
jgi:hypothetical protein